MRPSTKQSIVEAVRMMCRRKEGAAELIVNEAALEVLEDLAQADGWEEMRDDLAAEAVTRRVKRILVAALAIETKQIPLEGMEAMPAVIGSDGVALVTRHLNIQQYRAEERRLETKIRSYGYPRRKPARLEDDKKQLREMKKFDPRFAKYSAGDPDLELWKALETDARQSTKPMVKQRQTASAKRWKKTRSRSTKNQ